MGSGSRGRAANGGEVLKKTKATAASTPRTCSLAFWGVFGAVLVIAFTRAFTMGNPTQEVGRLFKIMRDGIVRSADAGSLHVPPRVTVSIESAPR